MIAVLDGFPDDVVAITAVGRVTRRDYDEVLIPKVNAVLEKRGKVRCYYELGPRFEGFDAGAVWEDFRLGVAHLARWERVAIVSDLDWIRVTANLFRFLLPARLGVFPTAEANEARAWIVAP